MIWPTIIDQIAILLTGVVAIWLTQDKREHWRRWACIFGMVGQPFWIHTALSAEQYGIFVINLLYTYAWGRGIWNHWLCQAAQRRWWSIT